MDFRFSAEQLMIRDAAAAFLEEACSSSMLREIIADEGSREQLWGRIVTEMGWQALILPEDCDGLGLGMVELAIVFEQCGYRLLASPLFSSSVAVGVMRACASESQRREWLPPVALGEETLALAMQRRGGCWDTPGLSYTVGDGGYRLQGEASYCVDGDTADTLLLVASASDTGQDGALRVFRVSAATQGIARYKQRALDQTRNLTQLTIDDLWLPASALLGEASKEPGLASTAVACGLDLGVIALAAEQLGVAQHCLDMTVAYTLEREQFGRPIAGFQAVKHKAADMMLRVECARSALYYAACIGDAWLAGETDAAALAEAASTAKAACGDAAFANAGEAIQLHGGNGFTWEYDVHLYFKRARASRGQFGSSDWHRDRIAEQLLGENVMQEPVA